MLHGALWPPDGLWHYVSGLIVVHSMGRLRTRSTMDISKTPLATQRLPATDETPPNPTQVKTLDKLDKILDAIGSTRERLESKLNEVSMGLSLLRDNHKKLTDRVTQS